MKSLKMLLRFAIVGGLILLLLIPLSLVLLGAAVWMFLWAVRRGQFEDLDTPALDILRDDDQAPPGHGDAD